MLFILYESFAWQTLTSLGLFTWLDSSNLQRNFLARILICSFESIKFLIFLLQILSRLVYVCAACMLRGTFVRVPITQGHPTSIFGKNLFGKRFEI